MKRARVRGILLLGGMAMAAAAACGGESVEPSVTDDGGGGGSEAGASGGSEAAASGSSGGTSSGTVGGGGPVPCGQAVCSAPNICCEAAGTRNGPTRTCEAQSACTTGLAIGCTAATCPNGAVCCAAVQDTPNGVTGSTTCMTSCPSNDFQLCTATTNCPAGEACVRIGGGFGGGTDILACIGRPDGGGFRDGGRPPPFDAGGGGG